MRELWDDDPFHVARAFVGSYLEPMAADASCSSVERSDGRNVTTQHHWQQRQPQQQPQQHEFRSRVRLAVERFLRDVIPEAARGGELREPAASLRAATASDRSVTFLLVLAYDGKKFCGWQRQGLSPPLAAQGGIQSCCQLPSVQQVVEDELSDWLTHRCPDRQRVGTAHRLGSNEQRHDAHCGVDIADGDKGGGDASRDGASTLVLVDVRASGRTDAGVHSTGQAASVRIRHDCAAGITAHDLQEALDRRATSASNASTDRSMRRFRQRVGLTCT
jgi:hypothetical protein